MTQLAEKTISLDLRVVLPAPFDGDPMNFTVTYQGDVRLWVPQDNELKIGTIRIFLVNLALATECHASRYEVIDALGDLAPFAPLIDFDSGEWAEDVELKFPDLLGMNLLVIDRVEIDEEHRGYGFGLLAARIAIDHLSGGCGLVAVLPYPLQYSGEKSEKIKGHEKEFEDGKRKLFKYWARLGLRRYNDDMLLGSFAMMLPSYATMMRGTKPWNPAGESE